MSDIIFIPETHEYFKDGKRIPGVTEILQSSILVDFSSVRAEILEASQKFGNAVHKVCELWDKNDLNISSVSEPLIPYLEAWKKFKKDYAVKVSGIERIVFSKRWGFAGKLDRDCLIDDKLTILDIKSSEVMQPATALQTAAYEIAFGEQEILKIKQRWGIYLKSDGKYSVMNYTDKTDASVFLSALQIHNWKRRCLK